MGDVRARVLLPGVTERTTTGFSLPATNPKPSTGSRLISTFRGAGGTNLSPSRRTSSRELLWETWLWEEDKLPFQLLSSPLVGFLSLQNSAFHAWCSKNTVSLSYKNRNLHSCLFLIENNLIEETFAVLVKTSHETVAASQNHLETVGF